MIQNLIIWNSFFENIISDITYFDICPAEKITHFTIQFRSKKPHFANLSSLDIDYKFYSKHVSVWCHKRYLHCSISWRPRTAFLKYFESKCLYISLYLLKKTLFQRRSKVLSSRGWNWGG